MDRRLDRLYCRYVSRGELGALARLFDLAAPELLAVARHLCGDEAEAEDAVQATFLTLIEKREQFDRTRRFAPWALGILSRHARAARRRAERELETELPERAAAHEPGRELARAELDAAVERRIAALPATYAEAVRAHLVEGAGSREIAARLSITPGAASVRVHRGLRLLRRLLPPGLAGAVLLARPARGLAALRVELLASATLAGASLAPPTLAGLVAPLLGGVLVKKLVISCVALAVLLTTWLAVREPRPLPPQPSERPLAPVATSESSRSVEATAAAEPLPPAAREGLTAEPVKPSEPAAGSVLVQATWKPSGGPAADVELELRAGELEPRTVRTDAEGHARFDELPPGPCHLRVAWTGEVTGFQLQAGEERLLTYELEPGLDVRGVVVDAEGRPVAGASVRLEAQFSWDGGEDAARTDAAGRLELLGVNPRSRITARAEGFAPSTTRRLNDADGDGAVELRLALPGRGGALAGRVVDPRGAPVAGATLEIGGFQEGFDPDTWSTFEPILSETDGTQSAPTRPLRVETDAEGRFTCAGIELGRVAVRVHPPGDGLASWSGHVEIEAEEPAWLEVRLGEGAAVAGRVTDPAGAPVAGVLVRAWSDDPWLHVQARTDGDGRYVLERIVPGHVELRANRERMRGLGAVERQLELADGARVEWNVALPGALAITGRLVDERGAPLAGWQARAYVGDEGAPVGGADRTDADGRFRLDGCLAELHRVELRPPDAGWNHPPRAWREGVQPGGPELELIADTAPPARVVGRVVDARGEALGEARIWATMTTTGRYVIAEAEDPSGAFAVEDLPAGRYALTVESPIAPNHLVGERELTAGETLDLGVVEIGDPAILVANVRGPAGRQIEGAAVELRTEEGYRSQVPIAFEAPGVARSGPAPAGRYALVVRAPGCATARRVVELVDGETLDLDVELEPGVECRFDFVVTAGENPPGIAARLLDAEGELALRCFAPDPERSGRIELVELLAPGRYTLLGERVNPALSGELAFEVPRESGPLRFTVPLAP